MAQLIFFCGHAGTGKTTLAKQVLRTLLKHTPYCLLDKDTLYGSYSASVMKVLTGDPNDRDSPTYLQHLRNPEYLSLIETAREQLSLGINTIVVGPFSQEIRSHSLVNPNLLQVPVDTAVKIVWVYLEEEQARKRIIERGDKRDQYKLNNWIDYSKRLFMPNKIEYPELILYSGITTNAKQFAELIAELK